MKRTLLIGLTALLLMSISLPSHSKLSEQPTELDGGEQVLIIKALITCYEGSGEYEGRLVCNLVSSEEGGLSFANILTEGVDSKPNKSKEVPVWM